MPAVSRAQEKAMYAAREGKSTLGIPKEVGEEFVGKADADIIPQGEHGSGAGIALMSKGEVLLLRRGMGGDFPLHWCFQGGHVEAGELSIDAARRKTLEESGKEISGNLRQLGYTDSGQFTFTTFGRAVTEFEPVLSDEHTEAGWFELDKLPSPMHPGCSLLIESGALDAIDLRKMNELDIARGIAMDELSSPQQYMNMWLFAIRITGTGVAYRSGIDEFVFRNPDMYLNDDFLSRCNGLQVISEHPEHASLDDKEFKDRTIGSIFLPYLKGNEVWGVAKIYDAVAAKIMSENQLSTSPTVVFKDPKVTNSVVNLEDGSTLLIEGKPSLLDHVAICIQGVWDKGGPHRRSANHVQENQMTPEELKAKADAEAKKEAEAKAKADSDAKAKADADEKMGQFMKMCDEFGKRMDAVEKKMDSMTEGKPAPEMTAADKKKDAEEAEAKKKADEEEKAKKDAEEEKAKKDAEEKEKMDAEEKEKAKADAEATRARIADLEARLPKEVSEKDYAELADAQAKADSVYSAFGDSAPGPTRHETLSSYRKRLIHKLKNHSAAWKDVDIYQLADSVVPIAEQAIYADSMAAATHPIDIAAGTLRAIEKKDGNGQVVRTFIGDPNAWMGEFKGIPLKQVGMGLTKGGQ